jgi:hypothetical protein
MDDIVWTPASRPTLTATAPAFIEFVKQLKAWARENPPTSPPLATGWHDITPAMALELLKRSRKNRRPSWDAVKQYARVMLAGQWVKTGEPIIQTVAGDLPDGQQRLYACLLSDCTFPCFVIGDAPDTPDLFAYLDSGRPRSAADAIYTAGENGLSSAIAQGIRVAYRYERNAFHVFKTPVIANLSNPEMVAYARAHPEIKSAAHICASNFPKTAKIIGNPGVAVFVTCKILQDFGPDVLGRFMLPLGSGANLDEDNPILALRNRLLGESADDKNLNPARRLGLIIKGFNLHIAGRPVSRRGFFLKDNEKFPRFGRPGRPLKLDEDEDDLADAAE